MACWISVTISLRFLRAAFMASRRRLWRSGYMVAKPRSSNSIRISLIPNRCAMGAYISKVSRAIRRRFSGDKTPRVRILCSRSASLTNTTRISRDIARVIFWKLSACCSALVSNSISVSLLTPSTRSATVRPKRRLICPLVTPVSSITSCSNPAIRLS